MKSSSTNQRPCIDRPRGGRPPKLSYNQRAVLRTLARQNPEATVEELCDLLAQHSGIRVSWMTMHRYLARAGIHRQPPAAQPPHAPEPAASAQAPTVPDSNGRYGYTWQHRSPGPPKGYPSSLTDGEWALVADLFAQHGPGKPAKYPRRLILDACLYVLRSGCQWRMLPHEFPPWQDVYKHFRRWTDKGLFERMYDRLRAHERQRQGRAPEPTAAVLDSQSVKTSPQGGPRGFDAGKKVKGRKRCLLVDVLGLLLAVLILPADVQDRDTATPTVGAGLAKCPTVRKVYVDGAFGGDCAQQLRELYKVEVEVVRRPSAAGSWTASGEPPPATAPTQGRPFPILPRRWVVERTHAWVERPRRLSKDYDRLLHVSTAWVWLSQARLLLRRLAFAEGGE